MPATNTKCRKCGVKFTGRGDLCLTCLPRHTALGSPAKKQAAREKARVDVGGPVCPHCRTEVTWDNLGTSETELSIYVREKMYFCGHCRSLLGFSSWHTEG
jgi:hypothetical protein